MADGRYSTAADHFACWRDDVLTGKPPKLYPVGDGVLSRVDVGPGLVTLVGGPPGAGKTALTMQWAVDALRLTPDLRALVCNVEMPPAVLLDRQLARLSGIPLDVIRYRRLGAEHGGRIAVALDALEPVVGRLAFVEPPFDLANVAASADSFGADLLMLDYIQRIAPPGDHGDRRGRIDATMDYLRQFAAAGSAVIVVAAVARTKDRHGRSSYAGDGLSLASFRESSELEYGCDDAWLVCPPVDGEQRVTVRRLKARYSDPQDLELTFDRALQRFTAEGDGSNGAALRADLAAAWNRTRPAGFDTEGVA